MGPDAVATFYYLGYVGSQKESNGSEIGAEPEWPAQAGGVSVMDNKLRQFENAKDASKYDTISPYLRDNEASMVYWLRNKVVPGYTLGFDMQEFAAYKDRLGDNYTTSNNEFPVKLVPIDHRDNSKMWRFTQVNDSLEYGLGGGNGYAPMEYWKLGNYEASRLDYTRKSNSSLTLLWHITK